MLPVVLHNDSQTPAAPTCCCVSSPDSCPALYLAKDAVLATFSVAKQTSVVVDAGHSATTGAQRAMLCAALPINQYTIKQPYAQQMKTFMALLLCNVVVTVVVVCLQSQHSIVQVVPLEAEPHHLQCCAHVCERVHIIPIPASCV